MRTAEERSREDCGGSEGGFEDLSRSTERFLGERSYWSGILDVEHHCHQRR